MSKADLLKRLDMVSDDHRLNTRLLAQSRETEVVRWERLVKQVEQNIHQMVRRIREDGLEKLSQSHFHQLSILTQKQTILQSTRTKVCLAGSEEEIQSLEGKLDAKYNISNKINLGPQINFAETELLKQLFSSCEVKIEMNAVARLTELKLNETDGCFSIQFSLLEAAKWHYPMVIASRDDKGYELMSRILQPLRSSLKLKKISPCTMENKWKYGLLPFGNSFARVAVRIFNREVDGQESSDNVLVIFLDDAKKYPKWTCQTTTFYVIPKEYHFRQYPAYTFHVWLTDKSDTWSEYGSNVKIPLTDRKLLRDFIMQFKSFDVSIPEVNCSVLLRARRGSCEPWAYYGDIFLAATVATLRKHVLVADNTVAQRSIAYNKKDIFLSYKLELEMEAKVAVVATDTVQRVAVAPSRVESPTKLIPKEPNAIPAGSPESVAKVVEPQDEKFYTYNMDDAERWANADNFMNPRPEEVDFWPPRLLIDQRAAFQKLRNDVGHVKIRQHIKIQYDKDQVMLIKYLNMLFNNVPTYDHLVDDIHMIDCSNQFANLLFSEKIIWKINGTTHLRESLIYIQKLRYPEFEAYLDIFQLPCRFSESFILQKTLRHDTVIHTSKWMSNNDHKTITELEIDYYAQNNLSDMYETEWDGTCPAILSLAENEFACELPSCLPELTKEEVSADEEEEEQKESTQKEGDLITEMLGAPIESSVNASKDSGQNASFTAAVHETRTKDVKPKVEVKESEPFTGRAPKFGEDWKPERKDARERRFANDGDSRSFPSRRMANGHRPSGRPNGCEQIPTNDGNRGDKFGNERLPERNIGLRNSQEINRPRRRKEYSRSKYDHNRNISSDDDRRSYDQKRIRRSKRSSDDERRRTDRQTLRNLPMTPSKPWPDSHPYNQSSISGSQRQIYVTRSDTAVRGLPKDTKAANFEQRKKRKGKPPSRRLSYSNWEGNESSNESSDAPIEYGEISKGEGVTGWNQGYIRRSRNNIVDFQTRSLADEKIIAVKENTFPAPTWKVPPDDKKEYTSRVLGIHNWRITEVEKLFQFCKPIDIQPHGQEWILRFSCRSDADLSAFAINGTKQKSSKSRTKIEVYVD